jgi:hypothetical protein
MIYIIEISHQTPVISWTAKDEKDFINKMVATYPDSDLLTIDDCEDHLQMYNNHVLIFMSTEDALSAYDNPLYWNTHKGTSAKSALGNLLGKE